jgi:hypothetical protein
VRSDVRSREFSLSLIFVSDHLNVSLPGRVLLVVLRDAALHDRTEVANQTLNKEKKGGVREGGGGARGGQGVTSTVSPTPIVSPV